MFYKVASIKYVRKKSRDFGPPSPLDRMSVVLFVRKIGLFLDLATKINFIMSLPLHEQALNVVLETFLK